MAIDYTKRPKANPDPEPQPGLDGGINYSKTPTPEPEPSPATSAPRPVSLSKITLTKSAPTVSLTKQQSAGGVMRVNLNWTSQPAKGGIFAKAPRIDLDLACLYELTDGTKGAVQALGNMFEVPGAPGRPLIKLDGDDRSGTNQAGENLLIDLSQSHLIKRILVFAFIYEGAPNWADAQGVVTLFPTDGPQVELHLDEADARARTCAIAMLENQNNDVVFRREVKYINGGQRDLDSAYGWGLRWEAGRK